MAKADIWMPLYVADYLADTSRLTTEQHGAYLLLLMDYWRNGAPPDDDQVLAQITKLHIDAWSIARAMLARFFTIENGCWIHSRVEEELAKASSNKASAKVRAAKGAAARWGDKSNASSNASSMPQAEHEGCLSDAPSPSPSPTPTPSNTTPSAPAPTVGGASTAKSSRGTRLPTDWVLPRSWGEWALQEKPQWTADDVRKCAERFKDFWIAKAGKDATKANWEATWRNWVRKENTQAAHMTPAQRRMAATDKAIGEWLNEGDGGNVIEGECHAR